MRVSYIALTSLVLVACGARTGLPTGPGDEPGAGVSGNGTGSTGSGASGSGGAGVGGTGVGGTAIGGSLLEPLACSADTTSPPAPEHSATRFWHFEAAEPGMLQNVGQGLHVMPNGRVLVTGQFDGTLVFRDSFGDSTLVSQGAQDVFVLCLEPDGSHGWSRAFGTASTDRGADITTDSQGNVYVVGETGASGNDVDFGAGPVTVNGVPQMFLVSYSAQGSYRWAKLFGGPYGSGRALRVAVDASDDVYLAGYVASLADFGGGAIDHQGEPDGFVASFGSDGDYRWDRTFGGSGYLDGAGADYVQALAISEDKSTVFATGVMGTSFEDPSPMYLEVGTGDIFVATLAR